MNRTAVDLFPGHPYAEGFVPNTPNVLSEGIRFKVPQGAALILPPALRLVAKLRDSAGTEITERSRIVLAKSVAGRSPVPFAEYRYGRYRYMTETDQLDSNKAAAVTQTLERPVVFDAGEELVILFDADLVIDPTKSTLLVSAFEDVA